MIQLSVMLVALLISRPTAKRVVKQFRKTKTDAQLEKLRRKYPAIPPDRVTVKALEPFGSTGIRPSALWAIVLFLAVSTSACNPEASAFEAAKAKNSSEALAGFLDKFPKSPLAAQATILLQEARDKEKEKVFAVFDKQTGAVAACRQQGRNAVARSIGFAAQLPSFADTQGKSMAQRRAMLEKAQASNARMKAEAQGSIVDVAACMQAAKTAAAGDLAAGGLAATLLETHWQDWVHRH